MVKYKLNLNITFFLKRDTINIDESFHMSLIKGILKSIGYDRISTANT